MEQTKIYKKGGAILIEAPGKNIVYLNIDDTRLYVSEEILMINDGQTNRMYELGPYGVITNESGTLEFSNKQDAMDYLILLMDASTATVMDVLLEQLDNNKLFRNQFMQLLRPLSIVGSGTNRLQVEPVQATAAALNATVVQATATNLNATIAIAAAQTLATLTSLTNIVNIGGLNALDHQFNMAHAAWSHGTRANVTF